MTSDREVRREDQEDDGQGNETVTVRLLEEPDESLPDYQPIQPQNRQRVMVSKNRLTVARSGSLTQAV